MSKHRWAIQVIFIVLLIEPWCHQPPAVIDNSIYVLSGDNLTASYHCIKGYTTGSSISNRQTTCSTTDVNMKPWTWGSADFICTPGKL